MGNRNRGGDESLECTLKKSEDLEGRSSLSVRQSRPRVCSNEWLLLLRGLPKFVERVKIPASKKRRPRRDKEKVRCETSEGTGSRSFSSEIWNGSECEKRKALR